MHKSLSKTKQNKTNNNNNKTKQTTTKPKNQKRKKERKKTNQPTNQSTLQNKTNNNNKPVIYKWDIYIYTYICKRYIFWQEVVENKRNNLNHKYYNNILYYIIYERQDL